MNSLNILLIEDDLITQIITKNIIKSCNYHLDIAGGVKDLFLLVQKKSYDLILIDLNLPEISTIKLIKKLIVDLKIKTPLIAISAFVTLKKKNECIRNGCKDLIEKPLTTNKLYGITKKYCTVFKI